MLLILCKNVASKMRFNKVNQTEKLGKHMGKQNDIINSKTASIVKQQFAPPDNLVFKIRDVPVTIFIFKFSLYEY